MELEEPLDTELLELLLEELLDEDELLELELEELELLLELLELELELLDEVELLLLLELEELELELVLEELDEYSISTRVTLTSPGGPQISQPGVIAVAFN